MTFVALIVLSVVSAVIAGGLFFRSVRNRERREDFSSFRGSKFIASLAVGLLMGLMVGAILSLFFMGR